jgi:ribonuclease Z
LLEVKTTLITLSLLLHYNAFCQSDSSTTDTSIITQVVFLGTGTPVPNPDRSGPSVAIVVNNTPYLIDLGPGVVRRATAAFRKGVAGLHYSKLKVAFITHLHSDHTFRVS